MNNYQLYKSIMTSISASIKNILNEDKKQNNTWRGIPNTSFIWHGEWSDPVVKYYTNEGSYTLSANDLEEFIYSWITDGGRDKSYEDCYDEYIEQEDKSYLASIIDEYVYCMELKTDE